MYLGGVALRDWNPPSSLRATAGAAKRLHIAAALALVCSCALFQHTGAADPGGEAREALVVLDRAYTAWFSVAANRATTRAELDRLATVEKTWEQWFGRIARMTALVDAAAPEHREAAIRAVQDGLVSARTWLLTVGVLGKGAP